MHWLDNPIAEDALIAAAFAVGLWYFVRQMILMYSLIQ
jgi:hypothetical protein